MSVRILGKCRPGKLFGCKSPLTTQQLRSVVDMLSFHREQKIAFLYVPGDPTKLPSPNATNSTHGALAHPDNNKYGLMHWKDMQAICMRREVLEEVVMKRLFKPGDDYQQLVSAIQELGLQVIDITVTE